MTKETLEEITEEEFKNFLEIHDGEFGGEYAYYPSHWPVLCNISSVKYYKVQPQYDEHMKECKRKWKMY